MIYPQFFKRLLLAGFIIIGFTSQVSAQAWNPGHRVGTVNDIYNYAYGQAPAQLVELQPAGIPNTSLNYSWESCSTPMFANGVSVVGSSTSYSPPQLYQTTYYRRKTTNPGNGQSIFSNTIKITIGSVNWEDINYVREHDVRTSGVTTWQTVDQLAIGPKLQTTSYMDGLGRSTQRISRETATPASGTLWGDVVQFSVYDGYGRENQSYLPYITTTQSGKFKATPTTDQAQYYTTNYNESPAYSSISFESSPLKRVTNVKLPGTLWAASAGLGSKFEVNTTPENVRIFNVDYVQGNPPLSQGAYPVNTLYKIISIDENGKKVIEYLNKTGQVILKKVQLDDSPSDAHQGWICTYSIYDDMGLLRYQIQPEGVKYLDANSWSFAGTNGQKILNEQCFLYSYDEKGRMTWKKTPGADPLNMVYDDRDRLIFTQDGNQAALATPQWTANLYDQLDRAIITTLYNTTKTRSALQTDINNATTVSTVTINNSSQAVNDIILNNRQTGISLYEARNSIELVSDANGSFESLPNDDFEVQINPAASQASAVTTTTYRNPISSSDLNNSSITTVLKFLFYDNYSFDGVKNFNTGYTNLTAYSTSDPDVIPIAPTKRTTNMPTGSKTRVLGSNMFLSSTVYYDERGQAIQNLEDNIKSGVEIMTMQHHFDGRTLSACSEHSAAGTPYSKFKILTKYVFDKLGRVTSLQKQFGSNAFKTLASYDYDDMGRVKTKHLDPGYTAGGNADLESLNYSYNIHSQLTGINKDYALKTPGNYNKWGHFFGLYLGFDNGDNVFSSGKLNGQVAGLLWNTQGDDAQRKYDYTYDNANRLVKAAFTEQKHAGDGWANNKMDFSVSGASGRITYDLNGNLANMLHMGVVPGTASPIEMDKLDYGYGGNTYSNKLQKVTDQMTTTTVNGLFGDFKDGSNGSDPDYVYDANGNLVIDLNKNVQSLNGGAPGTKGISYNFLDKPELIRIVGKGTVRIVYDADGNKLQRAFIPEGGGASSVTTYINGYTYQESATITTSTVAPLGATPSLAFINFEEGRIRVVNSVVQGSESDPDYLAVDGNMNLPGGKRGAYDYFIMDYQQNVRMILTEETHIAANTATMETARSGVEEAIFGQTGGANEVTATRVDKPSGWNNTSVGAKVSETGTIAGHNVGPNTLQKVMAGDKVTASVQYYYTTPASGNNTGFLSTVAGSLLQAISGSNAAGTVVKNNASAITTQLSGVSGFVNAVQPGGSNPSGTTPQAYLTILFFDERFNFIESADGGVVQQQVSSTVPADGLTLTPATTKAPKNGYVFVYVSNQSNQSVYFDNLKVKIATGNIIEENHYYAYGLRIAGISSKKMGDSYEGVLKNDYLYSGKELFDDGDLNWHDYGLRNYDAQIGRWVQQDPYQQFASPYVGIGNDPINLFDPSGGFAIEGLSKVGTAAVMTVGGAILGTAIGIISGDDDFTGTLIGAGAGLGIGLASLGKNIAISLGIQSANRATSIINNTINTAQAGASQSGNFSGLDKNLTNSTHDQSDNGGEFIIKDGKTKETLGALYVENYEVYEDHEAIVNDDGEKWIASGTTVAFLYYKMSKKYVEFQWIQSVTTNQGLGCGEGPFNDPCSKRHDSKPFYHNKADILRGRNKYCDLTTEKEYEAFDDKPGRIKDENKKVVWKAQTTLVAKTKTGRYTPLITLEWGFTIECTIDNKYEIKKMNVEKVTPSQYQKGLIQAASKL